MLLNMKYKSVAIDGPCGAGKSTIARAAAESLNYIYVDTGALYRAIGWCAAANGLDTTDAKAVISELENISISLSHVDGAQRVFANGKDVSEEIRKPEMAMHASNVSAIKEVREFLFGLQQDIAKNNNVIMDGRDIGTVVLPNADVKIYLTADSRERAKRRYDEHVKKGQAVDFDTLLKEVEQRDYNDSHRAVAPLKQAEDAVLVDTTNDSLDEAIAKVIKVITDKIGGEPK